MHFGLEVVTLGELADPRNVLAIALAAEQAGWEGLFVWDHLGFVWGAPAGDPFVILSAVAARTSTLKIGTEVMPLPRYRPETLARSLSSLDQLSAGRVILGAGLGGVPEEFTAFGQSGDPRQRAGMLDESLEVLDHLWSEEAVTHHGRYFTVENVSLAPLPVQQPRIPVWIGGDSAPALRRAARWDGWVTGGTDEQGAMVKSPEKMAEMAAFIKRQRSSKDPFDIAMTGTSQSEDVELASAYARAGVTWWLESLHGYRADLPGLLERVAAGSQRL